MLRVLTVLAATTVALGSFAREPTAQELLDAATAARGAVKLASPNTSPRFNLPASPESSTVSAGEDRSADAWALGGDEPAPPLLVLVSFTMPAEALHVLAQQAERIDAPLVLRGLIDDSMEKTAQSIAAMPRGARSSLAIDPTLFSRFGVDRVPTVVLPLQALQRCSETQCPVPEHVRVSGDAGLDYLLGQIERRASSVEARQRAAALRRQLESR